MNRSDLVQRIILLDQIAEKVKQESQALRSVLMLDAKAEFEEQGSAPTWRMPDLATVATAVTHSSVSVAHEPTFRAWVRWRYPEEVYQVERVREAWQAAFLGALSEDCDPATGEVIPGLKVREGGEFSGISIRATAAAKELFGAIAAQGLKGLTADASLQEELWQTSPIQAAPTASPKTPDEPTSISLIPAVVETQQPELTDAPA